MTSPTPRRGEAPLAALLAALSGALLIAAIWRRQRPAQVAHSSPAMVATPPADAAAKLPSRTVANDALLPPPALPQQVRLANEPPVSPTWQEPTKYIMGVLLLVSGVIILLIGRNAIPLVIMAALLALFLQPAVRFLMIRLRFPRGLAVAAPYLAVVLALVLAVIVVVPSALNALARLTTLDLYRILTGWAENINATKSSLAQSPILAPTVGPVLDELATTLQRATEGAIEPPTVNSLLGSWADRLADALGVLARVLTPLVAAVVSIFFVFLMSLQMMFAADSLKAWHPELIPPRYRMEIGALTANIVQTWVSFIRGQLTLMLLMGVLSVVGYLVLGVPQAILLGALAGLLELIPSLGPTLAAIPAVLFSLILGSTVWSGIPNFAFALIVTGFCVLLQLLENQVIVPRLMGDAVKLPPLIVLIGVIVGGSAFGILGAFLATPMIATFDQIFRFIYRKIQERPAIDAPEPEEPSLVERVTGFLRKTVDRAGKALKR